MSDANISTTGRAVGSDPLAPDGRARVQAMAEFTARGKAFRFPKGQSGNVSGQSRFYHACRKLAREASPEMMAGLIDLAKNAVDERVRSVCLIAVLDRAGVRPIDYDTTIDEAVERPKFDPSAYSPEELVLVEHALRLMVDRTGGPDGAGTIGSRSDRASATPGSGPPVFERPLVSNLNRRG